MGVKEDFTGRVSVSADAEIGDTRGGSGHGVPCPYGGAGVGRASCGGSGASVLYWR